MIPIQILINSFLYDTAQVNLPADHVDDASIMKPQNWDIRLIRRYMIVFGLSSSIFDLLTFWILRNQFSLTTEQFRTGWFMESLATKILVVFVVRTPVVPFFRSKPSKKLLFGALSCLVVGCHLPYLPFAHYLGFQLLPVSVILYLMVIIVLYLLSAEGLKKVIQHWSLNNDFFDLLRMSSTLQMSRMHEYVSKR
jgi:Mg2+-importing ATPase